MANRNRQTELGVNFWLSNEEIENLRDLLRKEDDNLNGRAVIYRLKDKETVRKWGSFFDSAHKSVDGEEASVRILPNGD